MTHRVLAMAAFVSVLPLSGWTAEVVGHVETIGGSSPQVVVWIEGPASPSAPPPSSAMSQIGMRFVPELLVAVAGQNIQFPNEDDVAHNVYSRSEARPFNLGIYGTGHSKALLFERPGVVDVRCSLHRSMNASILVVPNAFFAVTRAGESFQIAGVPAGVWQIWTWAEGGRAVGRPIEVGAGQNRVTLAVEAQAAPATPAGVQ